jgi:transcriptional regulator with XRE-family HTH domain
MGRSLRVRSASLNQVKESLKQQGYARQQDLANELQISRSTLSNYLNGRSVDYQNFMEISDALVLGWRDIADFTEEPIASPVAGFVEAEEFEPFIYIDRPPIEESCIATLANPGALLRIKAPWLMGKTALSYRLMAQSKQQGWHTASLNFHLASQSEFASLSQFLKWFCGGVAQLLQRPNQLEAYWDEEFSTHKMSCTDYFEQYLLPGLTAPLVLCLDEVDRIFPYPEVAADFFGLLRAWHERAKLSSLWQKLRLVLIYSTEVYIPLNLYESPFNVGQFIELPMLSQDQVHELAQRSELTWTPSDIEAVMDWLGGHPAYVQRTIGVCQRDGLALQEIWQQATTDSGIYSGELRHVWRMIAQKPELILVLEQAIAGEEILALQSDHSHQLYRLGLVDFKKNKIEFRCELYRRFFGDRLTTK